MLLQAAHSPKAHISLNPTCTSGRTQLQKWLLTPSSLELQQEVYTSVFNMVSTSVFQIYQVSADATAVARQSFP